MDAKVITTFKYYPVAFSFECVVTFKDFIHGLIFPVFSFTYFRYFVRFHYHHINLNIANVNSIVPEEGWFGQPKYSTKLILLFYVVSVSAFQFQSWKRPMVA